MPGHPWHPAIVHFPLACWVLATMVDVANLLVSIPVLPGVHWASVSHLLLWAGVALAVPAMIAGLIDYANLPMPVQDSPEITWHIVSMGIAWTIFLGAAIWRVRGSPFDSIASWEVTLLEVAGSGFLIAGGRFAAIVVFVRLPLHLAGHATPEAKTDD